MTTATTTTNKEALAIKYQPHHQNITKYAVIEIIEDAEKIAWNTQLEIPMAAEWTQDQIAEEQIKDETPQSSLPPKSEEFKDKIK